MEEEADIEGIKMVAAAGIDPVGMITFFEKLKKRSGEAPEFFAYVSTHPSIAERIETLKIVAAESRPPRSKFLPAYDWNKVKMRCRATEQRQE